MVGYKTMEKDKMQGSCHDNQEEQMKKKIHGKESLPYENMSYSRSHLVQTEDILKKDVVWHSPRQLLAYQMYPNKGETGLDNWHSEAERILRNDHYKQKGENQCLPKLYCYL
jgi:hypothetical protein